MFLLLIAKNSLGVNYSLLYALLVQIEQGDNSNRNFCPYNYLLSSCGGEVDFKTAKTSSL